MDLVGETKQCTSKPLDNWQITCLLMLWFVSLIVSLIVSLADVEIDRYKRKLMNLPLSQIFKI